jgi:hypothetical protein
MLHAIPSVLYRRLSARVSKLGVYLVSLTRHSICYQTIKPVVEVDDDSIDDYGCSPLLALYKCSPVSDDDAPIHLLWPRHFETTLA